LAVKFRMTRHGSKKRPYYRIVVADERYPRDGKFIEMVGTYNCLADPFEVHLDKDRIAAWFQKGVKPTKTVEALFKREGIFSGATPTQ